MSMMLLGAKLGISYQKYSLIYTLFDNFPHVCYHIKLESALSMEHGKVWGQGP